MKYWDRKLYQLLRDIFAWRRQRVVARYAGIESTGIGITFHGTRGIIGVGYERAVNIAGIESPRGTLTLAFNAYTAHMVKRQAANVIELWFKEYGNEWFRENDIWNAHGTS
jgi:hypothetical protein